MSLALIGNEASYEFRWRRWALLRDTVAAHLEDNEPGKRFPRLIEIGDALGSGSVRIVAAELGREIDDIARELEDKPVGGLVLGPRTAAALYPGVSLEAPRPLTRIELLQISPIGNEETLGQYFASMLQSIRAVCSKPFDDGTVESFDG